MPERHSDAKWNLHSVTKDTTGDLPSMPDIVPDNSAPIVRNADGRRDLAMRGGARRRSTGADAGHQDARCVSGRQRSSRVNVFESLGAATKQAAEELGFLKSQV